MRKEVRGLSGFFGVSSEARPAVPIVAHWLVNVEIRSLLLSADRGRQLIGSILSFVCI